MMKIKGIIIYWRFDVGKLGREDYDFQQNYETYRKKLKRKLVGSKNMYKFCICIFFI